MSQPLDVSEARNGRDRSGCETAPHAGARLAAQASLVLGLCACASVPRVPVKAVFHGHAIETTVDAQAARFYLEAYLPGTGQASSLTSQLSALHAGLGERIPTRDELRDIAHRHSVDLAALVFAHQLLRQPANQALQVQFLANLERVKRGDAVFPRRDTLIMMVPGFDYADNGPKTGADFAKPIQLLRAAGYQVVFVAVDPVGSVEQNGRTVAEHVRTHRHRRIAIAGASSAGPAIHFALGHILRPEESQNVGAWLNLGGILQGVPLIDHVCAGPKGLLLTGIMTYKGWRDSTFKSMRADVSRARFRSLVLPAHVQVVNYVGLSLSGDISDFAREQYLMMRDDGPNDGLTLLADVLAPNSLTILSPRTDHFFAEDPDINPKTLALLVTIMERMAP